MSSAPDTPLLQHAATLFALVRDFDRDAAACCRQIAEILDEQPERFYAATIEILKNDTESRAAQFLISLLVSRNLLFRALCDPGLDREHAMTLARVAIRVDPLVDTALARQLADATMVFGGAERAGTGERLMEILNEISDGRRIRPSLIRVLRTNNPYLRSKAVLMIGKGGGNISWIKRRLEEPDTRVRANAVEALWGLDGPEAHDLLEACTRDGNNRVAGNALLGLYLMGDSAILPEFAKMAGHPSAAFRRTAVWIMGESRDPRFSEILGRMFADPNQAVRKTAFAAVGQIRASLAQVAQTAEWQLAGSATRKDPRSDYRRISVAVVTAEGAECPRILPVQFLLSEDGQQVWSYRVVERPSPDAMTVVFLFPRSTGNSATPWTQGALRCLQWKRPTDLWCAVPYSGPEGAAGGAELELPPFIANGAQAAQAFQQTYSRADCTGFWIAMQRAVQGSTPTRGNRHLIILAADRVGEMPDGALPAIHASRTTVHILSTARNATLEDFCKRAGGEFQLLTGDSSVEERVSKMYLSLLARYEIRYQAVSPDAAAVRLRVHTAVGWGETLAPLPD